MPASHRSLICEIHYQHISLVLVLACVGIDALNRSLALTSAFTGLGTAFIRDILVWVINMAVCTTEKCLKGAAAE